jgi:transposase
VEATPLDRRQKKVRRLKAHLAFLDESGFLLIPNVRRTWAPRGQTPILWHRYRHDRISAISAVTVSFRRQHIGLYFHLHRENISQVEVVLFLLYLLRQIRGPIVLLWDGGGIHTGELTRAFLDRHPRLHVETFPAYAPELNPDERVWGHCKAALANGRPDNLDELMATLERLSNKARQRPPLLRSFVTGSDLPPFLRS